MSHRALRLFDFADGIRGHYCIGRIVGDPGREFWQYYNHGEWESAGEVFGDKAKAERQLAAIALTTKEQP